MSYSAQDRSLPRGCLYLPSIVPLAERLRLEEEIHKSDALFISPALIQPGDKVASKRVPVLSYGTWWSPERAAYEPPRIPLPQTLIAIGEAVFQKYWPSPVRIDSIVVNRYAFTDDKLAMHQDDLEDEAVRSGGSPVLTISLGQSCLFMLGGLTLEAPVQDVLLADGDAFLFGGESRMRFHGVRCLLAAPTDRRAGRTSVTYRQVFR